MIVSYSHTSVPEKLGRVYCFPLFLVRKGRKRGTWLGSDGRLHDAVTLRASSPILVTAVLSVKGACKTRSRERTEFDTRVQKDFIQRRSLYCETNSLCANIFEGMLSIAVQPSHDRLDNRRQAS